MKRACLLAVVMLALGAAEAHALGTSEGRALPTLLTVAEAKKDIYEFEPTGDISWCRRLGLAYVQCRVIIWSPLIREERDPITWELLGEEVVDEVRIPMDANVGPWRIRWYFAQ